MASTYSDLKFELIGTGEQSGTWGTTTNTNLGTAIQEAITGSADVTFASGTVTLTLTNTNASQTARNLRLNLTGTSGGAQDLIVPTIEKFYLVNNGCADAITVKNSTGTGIAVPAGKAMLLFNDGTNVVDAVTHMSSLTLTTALAIAQGGTGATTADTALDNLGGTTVGKAVFKAANAAAAQQAMDTEVGVDVQAYDAGLTDIAGLAVTDGNIIVGDGSNWVAESGATARTSLGLGSIATQASSSVSITGGSITGITDLVVADGGTGASSFTANSVLVGNGTSSFGEVAPGTSGNVLTSDGTTWTSAAIAAGGDYAMEVFTSPGTWTKPADVKAIKVQVVGGGGGGLNPYTPGYTGASGSGNTSSFGSYCSASGGTGAYHHAGFSAQQAGRGGIGSGGTQNIRGVPGGRTGPTATTDHGQTTMQGMSTWAYQSGNSTFYQREDTGWGGGGNAPNAGPTAYNSLLGGGGGGTAIEYLDAPAVAGPVAVTIGNGGNAAGPFGPRVATGQAGIIIVEYWS
jgi:hypothetical protein